MGGRERNWVRADWVVSGNYHNVLRWIRPSRQLPLYIPPTQDNNSFKRIQTRTILPFDPPHFVNTLLYMVILYIYWLCYFVHLYYFIKYCCVLMWSESPEIIIRIWILRPFEDNPKMKYFYISRFVFKINVNVLAGIYELKVTVKQRVIMRISFSMYLALENISLFCAFKPRGNKQEFFQ